MKLAQFLLFALAFALPAFSQDCTSKVQAALDHSDIRVQTLAPCRVWKVTEFQSIPRGDGLTGVLLIGVKDDVVVVGTVLRTKARLHLTSDLQLKLLQFNNELDWVKVGIDHDGDLFLRQELRLSALTPDELKTSIATVADASVQVYAALDQ